MRPFLRPLFGALALSLAATVAPAAETCRETIAAMYFDGPFDPGQRPPYRMISGSFAPDGTYTQTGQAVWTDPLTSISGTGESFMLVADTKVWTGPSMQGPWTRMQAPMTANREDLDLRQRQQNAKNLTETSCDGTYEIDGRRVERFTFRTRTDPDDQGMYFGALNTVYVDPAINQVVRWDYAENISSWAPEKSADRLVNQFMYDPSITIEVPQD